MANLQPITVKQTRITVKGCPGFWSSHDGGEVDKESVKYFEPAANLQKTIAGVASVSDLKLKRLFDPNVDKATIEWILGQMAEPEPFNVVSQPVNADVAGTPIAGGGTFTYPNCTILKYTPPKFDKEGKSLAMIEITVAVNQIPTYN